MTEMARVKNILVQVNCRAAAAVWFRFDLWRNRPRGQNIEMYVQVRVDSVKRSIYQ